MLQIDVARLSAHVQEYVFNVEFGASAAKDLSHVRGFRATKLIFLEINSLEATLII